MNTVSISLRESIFMILGIALLVFVQSTIAAPGDWPEPRQNGHLTGIQPLPGAMRAAPVVLSQIDLDRARPPITPVQIPGRSEYRGLAIVGGALQCYDTSGKRLWECHPSGLNFSSIVAAEDLDGDGRAEIFLKAGRPTEPYCAAVLVSLADGKLLWRYDVEPISYEWFVRVDHFLPKKQSKQIVVLMQGYPPDKGFGYICLFAFQTPGKPPVQVWRYDFDHYTARPSILRDDLDGDGVDEICVETHSRLWFIDARTGTVKQFIKWDVSPANMRSYGMIKFVDLNGDGRNDFLCIADFSQHHEVLLNTQGKMKLAWAHGWKESVMTGKVATTWADPPYADVDGDGKLEIVLSMYNSEYKREWLIRVYDALSGKLKCKVPGMMAMSVKDVDGDGAAEIAANLCADPTKNKFDGGRLLDYDKGKLNVVWQDNSVTFRKDGNKDAIDGFLCIRNGGTSRLTHSGKGDYVVKSWLPPVKKRGPNFSAVPKVRGVSFPTVLSADVTGDGKNEILVFIDPVVRVLKMAGEGNYNEILRYTSNAAPVVADLNRDGTPEIITGTVDPDRTPIVEAHTPTLSNELMWKSVFPRPNRIGLPRPHKLYIRPGRFTGKPTPDLYVYTGVPIVRSVLLDGRSGKRVWEHGVIPLTLADHRYWGPDMNLASVVDYNSDGKEDLVFTNPDYYCVASGPTGEFLINPLFPPKIFNQPSQGLYTFPAILQGPNPRPMVCLISGHYFQGAMSISGKPKWYTLPPVGEARSGTEGFLKTTDGKWLMGFGRQNGKFACINVTDGSLRWELDVKATCSDTVTCDVNGDGNAEFVFGTTHRELYAVGDNGNAPRIVWKTKLPSGAGLPGWVYPSGAGSPIVADVNGDGASEIVVPLADGVLYVLGSGKSE